MFWKGYFLGVGIIKFIDVPVEEDPRGPIGNSQDSISYPFDWKESLPRVVNLPA